MMDKMKRVVEDELCKICSRNPGFDRLFASDLGVGVEYGNWSQSPVNIGKDIRVNFQFIIEEWEKTSGREASAQKLVEMLTETKRSDYRMMIDNLEVGN